MRHFPYVIRRKDQECKGQRQALQDERRPGALPAGRSQRGKWWRFKYRFDDKEKLISLGTYPEISLVDARERREAARKQVANGIDPGEVRKAQKAAKGQVENSFEVIAREWHEKFSPRWSPVHADTTIKRLERDAFPWIGERPIAEIKAPELLTVPRRVESRGALETAHRVKTICGQVLRYAVATGRAERDSTSDLKGGGTVEGQI